MSKTARCGDRTGHGQAEPRAVGIELAGALRAVEPLEDVLHVFGCYADARVGDRGDDFLLATHEAYRHASARRRVAHGVVDQHVEHLP